MQKRRRVRVRGRRALNARLLSQNGSIWSHNANNRLLCGLRRYSLRREQRREVLEVI